MASRSSTTRTASLEKESDYVVPVIRVKIPASVGDGAFWALAGVALAGVVEPPVAALVVAGFLVARRRSRGVPSA